MESAAGREGENIGMSMVLLFFNIVITYGCIRYMTKEKNIVKQVVFTISSFLFFYLIYSSIAFVLDIFSIQLVLAAMAGTEGLFLLWKALVKRDIPVAVDYNVQPYTLPLLFVILGLLLSGENYGFFGMGQDQGVYQVKAIELMEGNTNRVYTIPEYEKLETDAQRETYQQKLRKIAGLDSIVVCEAETLALQRLVDPEVTIDAVSDNDVAGIFHGIPTHAAMLALAGDVVGEENMAWSQTLFYILTMFVIWFIAEELGLNRLLSSFACLIYLLSPEVVWVSKSTLTEGFHALIIAWFIYLLINKANPEKRWFSSLMVLAFSLWHVSIYAMIPMFIVLYVLMYAKTNDKQYIRAGLISAISFMLGYTFMVLVSPRYSLANTYRITSQFSAHPQIIWPLFMAIGLASVCVLLVLRRIDLREITGKLLSGKTGNWVIRGLLTICLLLTGIHIIRASFGEGIGLRLAMQQNGLLNYAWMTGVVVLPVLLVRLWSKPTIILQNEITIALGFLFFYSVLLYASVLKAKIDYCYYYGRYFVPYIPVLSLVAVYAFQKMRPRVVATGLAAAIIAMVPFDLSLCLTKDDTYSSYEELQAIGECLIEDDSAVVFAGHNAARLGFFPYRTWYGADAYFLESDVQEQMERLEAQYEGVYILHDTSDGVFIPPADTTIEAKVLHMNYADDNISYRIAPCPFPLWFAREANTFTLYRYVSGNRYEYNFKRTDGKYLINGSDVDDRRYLKSNGISYCPYISLEEGIYHLIVEGEELDKAVAYVTRDYGNDHPQTEMLTQSTNKIKLLLTLEKDSDQVEFCVHNPAEQPVIIDRIILLRVEE